MSYFQIINKGENPNRLFIGGVHGKEGRSTIQVLKQLSDDDVKEGRLVIYNCDDTPYLSTLKREYYQTSIGKEILYLIDYYQPQVYVELHCYKKKNYNRLTSPNRRSEQGVPPLIELEGGVLIGSVSPYIRTSLFKKDDVCMTLEMPCDAGQESLHVYRNILKIIAGSNNRKELEEKMIQAYPQQVETAKRYALEFFGDYPPF
ncbi:MAG: DUF2119 domain-containing protein [Methanobacteriaceae archaeon]